MSTATPTNQTPAGQGARCTGRARALLRDSRGALLLETVIASMVFALVGVAVLAGLSTLYSSGAKTEVQSVAENLARNQMEHIFSGPYREPGQTPYPTMSDIGGTPIPQGYSVSVAPAEFVDPGAPFPDPEVEIVTVSAGYEGDYFLELQTLRGRTDGLQLRYSTVPNRSGDKRLRGESIAGDVYIFLDDPETVDINHVEFQNDCGFTYTNFERPWDFNGGDALEANPWNTEECPGDNRRIEATVYLTDGETIVDSIVVSAQFHSLAEEPE